MDKFPEAFSRFERIMDLRNVESFNQLKMMFAEWAGSKWKETSRQIEALRIQARKHNLPTEYAYRRRFSSEYESFSLWMARSTRASRYHQRVINYMSRHPHATLREARGHKGR